MQESRADPVRVTRKRGTGPGSPLSSASSMRSNPIAASAPAVASSEMVVDAGHELASRQSASRTPPTTSICHSSIAPPRSQRRTAGHAGAGPAGRPARRASGPRAPGHRLDAGADLSNDVSLGRHVRMRTALVPMRDAVGGRERLRTSRHQEEHGWDHQAPDEANDRGPPGLLPRTSSRAGCAPFDPQEPVEPADRRSGRHSCTSGRSRFWQALTASLGQEQHSRNVERMLLLRTQSSQVPMRV
jgi:hypothetical protein